MTDTLITFETAKLAKEKGFNILQHSYYFEDGEFRENSLKGTNGYYGDEYEFNLSEFNENWNDKWLTKKTGDRCFGCSKQQDYLETFSAPTQSLLQKWLREVHNIHIFPWCNACGWAWELEKTNGTHISIMDIDGNVEGTEPESGMFKTYEEALEQGLLEALKLI